MRGIILKNTASGILWAKPQRQVSRRTQVWPIEAEKHRGWRWFIGAKKDMATILIFFRAMVMVLSLASCSPVSTEAETSLFSIRFCQELTESGVKRPLVFMSVLVAYLIAEEFKSNLRKRGLCFGSQLEGSVHCGREVTTEGAWDTAHIVCAVRKQTETVTAPEPGFFVLNLGLQSRA